MWKIEKIVSKGDYNYAVVPDHPKANANGYVLEHRIIMENYLGRLLNPNEVVHHKNEDKKDNCLENLELMDKVAHVRLHSTKGITMVELKCPQCEKLFSIRKGQCYLHKGYEYTCCSKSCRGKFSRKIQLHGRTVQVEKAISGNLVREYNSLDNPEETS